MTVHELRLAKDPFASIALGNKTIESRLYDDKRQKIKVGDELLFIDKNRPWRTLRARVIELLRHDTFRDLFESAEPSKFGKGGVDELLEQINEFYSEEDQKKLGVVGMVFEVITDNAVKKHSAGGVVVDGDRALVISWTTHDYVCFPKGGLEEGETSEQAALREVYEETGYKVKIVAPVGSWTYRYIQDGVLYEKTADYYLMELAGNNLPPTPQREVGEDFENLWLDIDEVKSRLTLEDSRQVFEKTLEIYTKLK